jgi:hypothetical protein
MGVNMVLGTEGELDFSDDPRGSPNILKMHQNIKMNEQLFSYDLVIVNYFNAD